MTTPQHPPPYRSLSDKLGGDLTFTVALCFFLGSCTSCYVVDRICDTYQEVHRVQQQSQGPRDLPRERVTQ